MSWNWNYHPRTIAFYIVYKTFQLFTTIITTILGKLRQLLAQYLHYEEMRFFTLEETSEGIPVSFGLLLEEESYFLTMMINERKHTRLLFNANGKQLCAVSEIISSTSCC